MFKAGDKVVSTVDRSSCRRVGYVYTLTAVTREGYATQYWYIDDEGVEVYTNDASTFRLFVDKTKRNLPEWF